MSRSGSAAAAGRADGRRGALRHHQDVAVRRVAGPELEHDRAAAARGGARIVAFPASLQLLQVRGDPDTENPGAGEADLPAHAADRRRQEGPRLGILGSSLSSIRGSLPRSLLLAEGIREEGPRDRGGLLVEGSGGRRIAPRGIVSEFSGVRRRRALSSARRHDVRLPVASRSSLRQAVRSAHGAFRRTRAVRRPGIAALEGPARRMSGRVATRGEGGPHRHRRVQHGGSGALLPHDLPRRARRMGEHDHPRITISAIPMARHMEAIRRDDWKGVADLMLDGSEGSGPRRRRVRHLPGQHAPPGSARRAAAVADPVAVDRRGRRATRRSGAASGGSASWGRGT